MFEKGVGFGSTASKTFCVVPSLTTFCGFNDWTPKTTLKYHWSQLIRNDGTNPKSFKQVNDWELWGALTLPKMSTPETYVIQNTSNYNQVPKTCLSKISTYLRSTSYNIHEKVKLTFK